MGRALRAVFRRSALHAVKQVGGRVDARARGADSLEHGRLERAGAFACGGRSLKLANVLPLPDGRRKRTSEPESLTARNSSPSRTRPEMPDKRGSSDVIVQAPTNSSGPSGSGSAAAPNCTSDRAGGIGWRFGRWTNQ